MKKNIILLSAAIMGIACATSFAEGIESKLINNLKYHKIMWDATKSTEVMRVKTGTAPECVGGFEEDVARQTEGFPTAFRPGNNGKEAWLLDSINGALKLFDSGKLVKNINIKSFGILQDFAINKSGDSIAFLNREKGNIYITDASGKLKTTIDGYAYATSLEFDGDGNLLIIHPMAGGIVKITTEGQKLAVYEADQTLSNYSNEMGLWGLESANLTTAKLYVRNGVESNAVKVVAEIPFVDYKDKEVEYKGGNIYGFDAEGNLYFGLVAADLDGVCYRERIYKCDSKGKILGEKDIIDVPVMSPGMPRQRVVTPEGKVVGFWADCETYCLHGWEL